jgi:hypothetical protein
MYRDGVLEVKPCPGKFFVAQSGAMLITPAAVGNFKACEPLFGVHDLNSACYTTPCSCRVLSALVFLGMLQSHFFVGEGALIVLFCFVLIFFDFEVCEVRPYTRSTATVVLRGSRADVKETMLTQSWCWGVHVLT